MGRTTIHGPRITQEIQGVKTLGRLLRKIDFFAAYVIPEDAWYLLPAAVVLQTRSLCLMLCPVQHPRKDSFHYEVYREAWTLLRKTTLSP